MPVLLARPERVRQLLKAVESGQVGRTELSVSQLELLRQHKDPALREQAQRLFADALPPARPEAIKALLPALQLTGVPAQGQKIFLDRCATCHRAGQLGQQLGPDLATVKSGGKEKVLFHILDPNREVNPNYVGYEVETREGDSLTGIIAGESASGVTLRQAGGIETVLLRANILQLRSQGKSLMPEGLETGLSPQDMADLLEFIMQ